jgi:phosphoglycerate kinase
MKNLNEINFQNIKKVGIRVDFNVPTNDSFQITDNTRLLRAKDTIDFILKNECKILLLSHFGRPKELFDEKFSFINLINQFSDVLGYEIQLLPYEEFLQNGLKQFNASINKITLLDNIRFFEGEKKNDEVFSQSITNELDLFVNEAFSASHRSHASVNQMAKNILSAPGLNFSKEVNAIKDIKSSTKKKLAIIGGSKVSTKIKTLLSLTQSCSNIFIGGAMANNFLKHQGIAVGQSLLEEGSEEMIKEIYTLAKKTGCEIHLPTDVSPK